MRKLMFCKPSARYTYEQHRNLLTGVRNHLGETDFSVYAYTNDEKGQRVSKNDEQYGYNVRGELVSATGNGSYAYQYDDIGNRRTSAECGENSVYTANSLNQYTSIEQLVLRSLGEGGSNNFSYDADGNLTNDGRNAYVYDGENRLVSVTPLNPQSGARAIENAYDHRSRRIRKVVKHFDGAAWQVAETHTFVWDGWNIVFEQIAFSDNTTRTIEYFWGNDVSGTEQGAGGVGGLLATRIDGVLYFPVYDGNGNIMMYVNAAGDAEAQYDYDPYGNILQASGPRTSQFAFGFSTKYHDREVGLVAYQLRVYNPVHGRWLNRDPIGEDGGENLYAFADNQYEIDYLGLDRMITFARRKWPGRYYAGEDTAARNLMRCIERLNVKKKGNCLCFNIQIKDFVLATLEDIGKDVRVSDEVFMFSHGGLLVNGKPWQQDTYTWNNPNDKVEELMFPDLSSDVGVNLNSLFAVGVKEGNVFGCYLSPGHRKFKHWFWSTPVSSISQHAENCAMIQERLEQLEIKNKGCKRTVKVSIYEGEFKANKAYKWYTTERALLDEMPVEE